MFSLYASTQITNGLVLKTSSVAQPLSVMLWWHFIVIIASLLLGLLILIAFINRITKGQFEFGFFKSFRKNKEDDPHPHATCINRGSLLYIITRISDTSIKIHDIKARGILAGQMLKAEEYLIVIKDFTLTHLSGALEKGNDWHPDYFHFRLILQECLTRVKDIIRVACINNGFQDMDHEKYNEYMEDIYDRIGSMSHRFFIENYSGKTDIQEIFGKEYGEKVKLSIKDMFSVLRTISLNNQKKIKELSDLQNKVLSIDLGFKG